MKMYATVFLSMKEKQTKKEEKKRYTEQKKLLTTYS